MSDYTWFIVLILIRIKWKYAKYLSQCFFIVSAWWTVDVISSSQSHDCCTTTHLKNALEILSKIGKCEAKFNYNLISWLYIIVIKVMKNN